MIEEVYKVYKVVVFRAGYKRVYEVSNYGNVKVNGVITEPRIHIGYKYIAGFYVYRAVAELFIPNPENKPCVDHIDTNRLNDNVENLHWVTHKENMNNPITKQTHRQKHPNHKQYKQHKQHKTILDSSKMGKGTLGKHKVWDDKATNKYHYE